ncbi:serine hydrolase [Flavobacterium sp. RNTU_13]|uniref:serine hydrolase n=1 Tax=Flavobacterium sp. RNTU_13 TaxID=3375145 RepID=UPI0039879751
MKKFLLFTAAFITLALNAQQAKLSQIDSLFTSLSAKKQFNGNVLLAEKGNIIYQKSFGLRDEARKLPLDANSVFELASVSKQFTAMAVVLLQEKGKLQYDDKLGKYLPELAFYKDVTLRQLLNHTAGLPDYMDLIKAKGDTTKIWTNKDMIALFAKEKPEPVFAAGSKYEYSNTGYALLASVIEKASGKTYADFLQQNIFRPLKMNSTFVYTRRLSPKKVDNYAYGYVYDKAHKKQLPDDLPEYHVVWWLDGIVGDGTVNASAPDLLKWDRALYANTLVSKKSMELIQTPPALPNGEKTKYGFGWVIDTNPDYGKLTVHSGGWFGYVTFIERDIDNDKTIIILQNHEEGKLDFLKPLRRLMYGKDVEKPDTKEITLSPDKLTPLVGKYLLGPGIVMEMSVVEGTLYTQITGQPRFEVFAESETNFFLKEVPAKLVFTKNDKGNVTGLTIKQGGRNIPATKMN